MDLNQLVIYLRGIDLTIQCDYFTLVLIICYILINNIIQFFAPEIKRAIKALTEKIRNRKKKVGFNNE